MYTTLIQAADLRALMARGDDVRVMDCSFDLMNPDAGRRQFEEEHVVGAVYVHLDKELSDKTRPASEGRHPLPSPERFADRMAAMGVSTHTQVVVMDRQGASFCARLWWMLRWCGHEAVAVLDGGMAAWKAVGGAIDRGPATSHPVGNFHVRPARVRAINTHAVAERLASGTLTIIDARAAARFRGEVEPLDPVAGHIPGALNRPFSENLQADGRFKPAEVLRAEFLRLLGQRDPSHVVHQCGSGVSAVPNLLAMEIAGLGSTTLYPGSWSAWSNTGGLPCARA